jgi:hypothetical protein
MNQYPEKTNQFPKPLRTKLQLFPGYTGLYLSAAFRGLGMNLIGLFVPLYIFKLTGSLAIVFLFFALYHFSVIILDYPTAILVKTLGIDLIGFLGVLARTGFILLLVKAEANSGLIWPAALTWGLTTTATWLPFHYSFTVAEKEDGKYGKEVSRLEIINRISWLVGPAAGGLVIVSLGFKSLYSFAIILVLISGLPLFFDTIKDKGMRLSLEKISRHLVKKERIKFWLSLAGAELESVVLGLAWPLFIFLAIKNYEVLGLIKSGAALFSVVIVWFLGKWIDRKGKSILHLGTLVNSFNVLLRSFLFNPFAIFLIDSLYDVISNLIVTPFKSAFYEEAIKMRKLEFMVEREFVIHFSGLFICLFLSLVFSLGVAWFWIFSLGVIGLLLRNYILSAKNNQ